MTTEDASKDTRGAHCCFCFQTVVVSPEGDGFDLRLTHEGSATVQHLWAHSACLHEHLHEKVPFSTRDFDLDPRR